jgi:methylphosphotriester-DNA--protein-cysteine methyltransferase
MEILVSDFKLLRMIFHNDLERDELRKLIHHRIVKFGGNKKLKIYGRLNCGSGKRMKRENRIFFSSEEEAMEQGYRACGNCIGSRIKKLK